MRKTSDWTYKLPDDVYTRLCECRNKKDDLEILIKTRWEWMKEKEKYRRYTVEDAMVYIMELLDCNNQYYLTNLTVDEYDDLLISLK